MAGQRFIYPPGFRFHPTEDELVGYYLRKKVSGEDIEGNIITEVDLYKIEPWDLPESSILPESDRYFFSPRDRKYPNGGRTNRATEKGYWKATGKDRPVLSGPHGKPTGMKKTLVFYLGRAPNGARTDWVMHEYRLEEGTAQSKALQTSYVLCRIFNKKGDHKDAEPAVPTSFKDNKEDVASGQMVPPLLPAGDDQMLVGEPREGDMGEWDLLAQFNHHAGELQNRRLAPAKQESVSEAMGADSATPSKGLFSPSLYGDEIEQEIPGEVPSEVFFTPEGHMGGSGACCPADPIQNEYLYEAGSSAHLDGLDWAAAAEGRAHADLDLSIDDVDEEKLSLDEVRSMLNGLGGTNGDAELGPGIGRNEDAILLDAFPSQQHPLQHQNGHGFLEVDSWINAEPHMQRVPAVAPPGAALGQQGATAGTAGPDQIGPINGSRSHVGLNRLEQPLVPSLVQLSPGQGRQLAKGAPGRQPLIGPGARRNLPGTSFGLSQGRVVKLEQPTRGEVGSEGGLAGDEQSLEGRIKIRPRANGIVPHGALKTSGIDQASLPARRIRMAVHPAANGAAAGGAGVAPGRQNIAPGRPSGIPGVTSRGIQNLRAMLKEAAEGAQKKQGSFSGQPKKKLPEALLRELASRLPGGRQREEKVAEDEDNDVEEISQADMEAAVAAKFAPGGDHATGGSLSQGQGHAHTASLGQPISHSSRAAANNPENNNLLNNNFLHDSFADGNETNTAYFTFRSHGEEEGDAMEGFLGGDARGPEEMAALGDGEDLWQTETGGSQSFWEAAMEASEELEREVGGLGLRGVKDEGRADCVSTGGASGQVYDEDENILIFRQVAPLGDIPRDMAVAMDRWQDQQHSAATEEDEQFQDEVEEDDESSMSCARIRLVPGFSKSTTAPATCQADSEVTMERMPGGGGLASGRLDAGPMAHRQSRSQVGAQTLPRPLQSLVRLLGAALPAHAAEMRTGVATGLDGAHLRPCLSAPALLRAAKSGSEESSGKRACRSLETKLEKPDSPSRSHGIREVATGGGLLVADKVRRRMAGDMRSGADLAKGQGGESEGQVAVSPYARRRPFLPPDRPRQAGAFMWIGMFVAVLSLCVGVVSLAKLALRSFAHT